VKQEIGEWRNLAGNGDWEGDEARGDSVRGEGAMERWGEGRHGEWRECGNKRLSKKGRTFADQY